jgi:hypothetical protein
LAPVRQKGDKLLASSTGDVGLMQVNRTTWRSLYDVKGLSGDMSYNGYAGAEILHQYLTRYAIPKKEDKQPGGHLARATYSAYNAGPRGLGRYRGVRQSALEKSRRPLLGKVQSRERRLGAGGKELLRQLIRPLSVVRFETSGAICPKLDLPPQPALVD